MAAALRSRSAASRVVGEIGSESIDEAFRSCWRVCEGGGTGGEAEAEAEAEAAIDKLAIVMGLKAPGARWPVSDEAGVCIIKVCTLFQTWIWGGQNGGVAGGVSGLVAAAIICLSEHRAIVVVIVVVVVVVMVVVVSGRRSCRSRRSRHPTA